jgi:hypothetical protein
MASVSAGVPPAVKNSGLGLEAQERWRQILEWWRDEGLSDA